MEKIITEYEKMLDKLFGSAAQYPEKDMVLHTAAKGHSYSELMVIGRAVNGWDVELNSLNSSNKSDLIEEVTATLRDENWMGNLKWVTDRWASNDGNYNTKRSAFWRLVNELAYDFSDDTTNNLYFDSVVWSNLYKVVPNGGGNPSAKLRNIVFESCLNILREEIAYFKPKYIVFLTGYQKQWWAKPFLDSLQVTNVLQKPIGFVEFAGVYNNITIVVGQHPQGKNGDVHLKNILDALALVTQSQSEIK